MSEAGELAVAPQEGTFQPRVLIADDDPQAGEQLRQLLEQNLGVHVDTTRDGKDALDLLGKKVYSVLLTDLKMPRLDGMHLIHEIAKHEIPVTVVVMTGFGSIDAAVEAMRAGADDFLTKPIDVERLELVLRRALRERALKDELMYLREKLGAREAFTNIITKSPKMLAILDLVTNLAQTPTTVLIEGETGTGKELIARAVHQASAKLRPGPLIAINCAALPETLLESELFGHEKGSFTGAVALRKGRFEQAHGGTLFLDEIGEIQPAIQVKLLRVLQERRFERVGGTQPIEVDVRVVVATNRSLLEQVKKGNFREDLYYRVNVVRVELPPLRDRPEDIPLLISHFCQKFAKAEAEAKEFSPEAMEVLLGYHWPGNIRELENVVERACITTKGQSIGGEQLGPELTQPMAARSPFKIDLSRPLPDLLKELAADFERRYIRKALRKTRGNVGRCAQICGLSRRSITTKIAEYKIDRGPLKEQE